MVYSLSSPSPMSSRVLLNRKYASRTDQTLSPEMRHQLSQAHRTNQIVTSVRNHYLQWQKACEEGAHTFILQQHSSNIQKAIARIMMQQQWTHPVEQAVRDILGGSAHLNIETAKWHAERRLNQHANAVTVSDATNVSEKLQS